MSAAITEEPESKLTESKTPLISPGEDSALLSILSFQRVVSLSALLYGFALLSHGIDYDPSINTSLADALANVRLRGYT